MCRAFGPSAALAPSSGIDRGASDCDGRVSSIIAEQRLELEAHAGAGSPAASLQVRALLWNAGLVHAVLRLREDAPHHRLEELKGAVPHVRIEGGVVVQLYEARGALE